MLLAHEAGGSTWNKVGLFCRVAITRNWMPATRSRLLKL